MLFDFHNRFFRVLAVSLFEICPLSEAFPARFYEQDVFFTKGRELACSSNLPLFSNGLGTVYGRVPSLSDVLKQICSNNLILSDAVSQLVHQIKDAKL